VTAVIDLGEGHGDVGAASPVIGPRLKLDKRIGVAVVAIVVLALITAGAPLLPPPVPRLLSVPASSEDAIMLDAGHLYVADTNGRHATLSSYAVPGGTSSAEVPAGVSDGTGPLDLGEWSVGIDMSPADLSMELRYGLLLLQQFQGSGVGTRLEVFDPRTGRQLWRSGGTMFGRPGPPGTLLLNGPVDNEVQAVDLRTGRPRWQMFLSGDCQYAVSPVGETVEVPAQRLIEVCEKDSQVHVIDLATGTETGSAPVNLGDPEAPPPSEWSQRFSLTVLGGVIVVAHGDTPTPVIDAYAEDGLRPIWGGKKFVLVRGIYDCLGKLCVDGEGVQSVLDPHTGHALPPIVDPPLPPAKPNAFVLVVDPTSPVATLSGSTAIELPARSIGESMPAPVYRGAWEVWASVKSPNDKSIGGVHVSHLQLLHGVRPDSCVTVPALLLCATATNELTLWRLPAYLG
jgi:hypothetical protein